MWPGSQPDGAQAVLVGRVLMSDGPFSTYTSRPADQERAARQSSNSPVDRPARNEPPLAPI